MKRITLNNASRPFILLMTGIALTAATASAQTTVFFDDFENGANDATVNRTTGGYSQTPDVDAYTVANTSGQANSTLWVRASSGFNSSRNGLIDESENGGANFTDPVGSQAYGFRYTNAGVTTAEGLIGPLNAGTTITVTFDVCVDGFNAGNTYDALLVLFNPGAARNRVEYANKDTAAVLAKASGTTSATNPWETITFSYTVGDNVVDADGDGGGTPTGFLDSLLGKDIALRFDGATNSANIDNVTVEIDTSNVAYWDIDGSTAGAGGATPSATWNAAATRWNPEYDGTGTVAAWTPGKVPVFAAGTDATGSYTVTIDGAQNISGLIVEEGAVNLANGTSGSLNLTANADVRVIAGTQATIGVPLTDADDTQVFEKLGDGLLVLSGNNGAANGGMLLSGGITRFESATAINGTGENVTINSGATLAFGASFGSANVPTALADRVVTTSAGTIAVDNYATGVNALDFDFSNAGLDFTSAYLGAISDLTYDGLFTPNGTTYRLGGGGGKLTLSDTSGMDEASPTIDVRGNVEISGDISGFTGTLTKQGSGTLTLSGANSYAANTTASGGILKLAGSNNQATQTTINAATLQLASNSNGGLASGQITMNNNSAVLQAVDGDRTIGNDVLINASPTISGPQSLTINGALTINNNRQLNNNIVTGESLTLAGQINLSNNDTGRTLTINSGATSGDVGIGKTFITGNIADGGAGAGGLTLTSGWRESQPFYLSGTNTYTGLSEFKNGLVTIQGKQALSPGTTVRLNHTSGSNGQIALLDDGSGNISLPNTFQTYTNNSTGNHSIFVGNNNTANGGTSSGTTTGSTFVIPTLEFNFIKADTQYSSVNITGANDYSLRIDSVVLNNANARNAANNWQARFNPTTASVSLGTVTMPDGNNEKGIPFLQLEGSATGNIVTGAISEASDALGTGQPLSLNKTGASEWTLEGANTYTGATTITGGLLVVNGSLDPASAVAVNGGTLGGSGTVGGTVTVAAAANLAPGASVGTLSIGGGLDISALAAGAGLLDFEIGPIASSDRIAVTGTLTIGTGTLGLGDFNLANVGGLEEGVYTLITSGGISGTLDAGDLEGTIGATDVTLGTSGNNIILTVGTPSGTPYELWAGPGVLFDGDENGDGVSNGLAFLLGATDPDADALGLLPTVTKTIDGLVMTFDMLDSASRGTATLSVEHSSDLGITDAWTTVAVPDSSGGPTSGVTFVVSGSGTLDVTATIGVGQASGGKLFGRLKATE